MTDEPTAATLLEEVRTLREDVAAVLNVVRELRDASADLRLTQAQAARYLRVSVETLRRWEAIGRLPEPRWVGRSKTWSKRELDRAEGRG